MHSILTTVECQLNNSCIGQIYWNSKLSGERKVLVSLFAPEEVTCPPSAHNSLLVDFGRRNNCSCSRYSRAPSHIVDPISLKYIQPPSFLVLLTHSSLILHSISLHFTQFHSISLTNRSFSLQLTQTHLLSFTCDSLYRWCVTLAPALVQLLLLPLPGAAGFMPMISIRR
jgi:hypothetical protein